MMNGTVPEVGSVHVNVTDTPSSRSFTSLGADGGGLGLVAPASGGAGRPVSATMVSAAPAVRTAASTAASAIHQPRRTGRAAGSAGGAPAGSSAVPGAPAQAAGCPGTGRGACSGGR